MTAGTGVRPRWSDYSARWATLHGRKGIHRAPVWLRVWRRLSYGVGRALAAAGARPNTITAAGLAASLTVPVVVVFRGQWLFLAAGLVAVAAMADSADGAVAVINSRATRLGSFYDAVADRLGEAAWLLGLWLIGVPGALLTVAGALMWLHEYARLRAAAVGMTGGGTTLSDRSTRVLAVIAAFGLGGLAWLVNPHLTPGAATVVVAVWVLLGFLGTTRLLGAIKKTLVDLGQADFS